jgi:hypothetical protein
MWHRHDVEVWRGGAKGETSKRQDIANPVIVSGLPVDDVPFSADGVTVQFQIPGEQRGSTFNVWVGSSSFDKLAAAMLEASPKRAEIAFLSSMLKLREKMPKGPQGQKRKRA